MALGGIDWGWTVTNTNSSFVDLGGNGVSLFNLSAFAGNFQLSDFTFSNNKVPLGVLVSDSATSGTLTLSNSIVRILEPAFPRNKALTFFIIIVL